MQALVALERRRKDHAAENQGQADGKINTFRGLRGRGTTINRQPDGKRHEDRPDEGDQAAAGEQSRVVPALARQPPARILQGKRAPRDEGQPDDRSQRDVCQQVHVGGDPHIVKDIDEEHATRKENQRPPLQNESAPEFRKSEGQTGGQRDENRPLQGL